MAYRGVLLDLFGTLVHFDARRLPELPVGDERVRTTVGALGPLLAEWVPGVTPEAFWPVLLAVSEEMARARAEQLLELPSRERFRRALERVGCGEASVGEAAVSLSRAHMAAIVAATVFPAEHAALLVALRRSYRLGVVSNFDDTGAAYDILARHGVLPLLDTVVVSEALGLRKPHPALVRTGLRGLGLAPHEALFVGDTFADDVGAATAAGTDAAWIDARGAGVPDGAPAPRYVLRALAAMFLVGGLNWFYESLLQRELDFRARFFTQAVRTVAYAAVAVTHWNNTTVAQQKTTGVKTRAMRKETLFRTRLGRA